MPDRMKVIKVARYINEKAIEKFRSFSRAALIQEPSNGYKRVLVQQEMFKNSVLSYLEDNGVDLHEIAQVEEARALFSENKVLRPLLENIKPTPPKEAPPRNSFFEEQKSDKGGPSDVILAMIMRKRGQFLFDEAVGFAMHICNNFRGMDELLAIDNIMYSFQRTLRKFVEGNGHVPQTFFADDKVKSVLLESPLFQCYFDYFHLAKPQQSNNSSSSYSDYKSSSSSSSSSDSKPSSSSSSSSDYKSSSSSSSSSGSKPSSSSSSSSGSKPSSSSSSSSDYNSSSSSSSSSDAPQNFARKLAEEHKARGVGLFSVVGIDPGELPKAAEDLKKAMNKVLLDAHPDKKRNIDPAKVQAAVEIKKLLESGGMDEVRSYREQYKGGPNK